MMDIGGSNDMKTEVSISSITNNQSDNTMGTFYCSSTDPVSENIQTISGLKAFKKKHKMSTTSSTTGQPQSKIDAQPPMPPIEEAEFEDQKNMNQEDLEFRLDNSTSSILESKHADLTFELENNDKAKRVAENFRRTLVQDFADLKDEKDLLEDKLKRERETKRVFEKEVGKLKKIHKQHKIEYENLNRVLSQEISKISDKEANDNDLSKLDDGHSQNERYDYQILILKEKNNTAINNIKQHEQDQKDLAIRVDLEGKEYMDTLKDTKKKIKEETDKNLGKISDQKEEENNLQLKLAESSNLRDGYKSKNEAMKNEELAQRDSLEQILLNLQVMKKDTKVLRNERVNNNKVQERRMLATQEEIVRLNRENSGLQERIDSVQKGLGDPGQTGKPSGKLKLFGDFDSDYC